MAPSSDNLLESLLCRVNELKATGTDSAHAWDTVYLEHKIKEMNWPERWGDDFGVLIYGDFQAPTKDLVIPDLGITVHHEQKKNTVIRSAQCVLEATVRINERSLAELLDAVRRVNILLGAWTLVTWGNCGCGWYSHILSGSAGVPCESFDHENLLQAIEGACGLPSAIQQKIDAALYWLREPQGLMLDHAHNDLLHVYAGYWNAFECLVDAVLLRHPQSKQSKKEKQDLIESLVAERGGKLTSAVIAECYQKIVNPGFVGRASHALTVCFPEHAATYIEECFHRSDRPNRLYDIRNAINHGEIDAENPEECARIARRKSLLWIIVFGMIGLFVPYPRPVD